jgi:hypothetical protein
MYVKGTLMMGNFSDAASAAWKAPRASPAKNAELSDNEELLYCWLLTSCCASMASWLMRRSYAKLGEQSILSSGFHVADRANFPVRIAI